MTDSPQSRFSTSCPKEIIKRESSYTPVSDDFQLTITSVTSNKSLQGYLARQTALRLAYTLKLDGSSNSSPGLKSDSTPHGDTEFSPYFDDSSRSGSVYTVQGERQEWSSKAEFILSCLGYSIGLGNIWRFPYICYKSGGGAFLISYFIMMLLCGVPILFMELVIGQYFKLGPIGALGYICPLLKGAGVASLVVSFFISTYYNVIISWTMYYLFNSFRYNLPWSSCDNLWNSKYCWSYVNANNKSSANQSLIYNDSVVANETRVHNESQILVTKAHLNSPSEEFYSHRLLDVTSGIDEVGYIRPELFALLLLSWVMVYFCIWKSIRSSGKVVYFTVVFPFILLIAFMINGLTLPGANIGINYFFKPRWNQLLQAKVWVLAATQSYSSLGIAYGCMTVMASYNKFSSSILPDTLIISFVNTLFSLLAGVAVFSTLGHISFKQGRSIENIVAEGPGLVFVAIPEAISNMPVQQLWAVFFFLLLLLLGLDSQFALVEVIITSLTDSYNSWLKQYLKCHEALVLVICAIAFLCGIPYLTQGGVYFLTLVDHYAASISINYIAFFEVIAVSWFYGVDRLVGNIYEMTGKHTSYYFKFCWRFASPVLIFTIAVFSLIDYKAVTYNKTYTYPVWAEFLGWTIALTSILVIPITAIKVLWEAEGSTCWQKLRNSVKSSQCSCYVDSMCMTQMDNEINKENIENDDPSNFNGDVKTVDDLQPT